MKKLNLYLFFVFTYSVTFSQGTWKSYTYLNSGFTSGSSSSISEDSAGNMWFTTFGNGAYKFDGTNWFNFKGKGSNDSNSIGSNSVVHVYAGNSGKMWFSYGAGGKGFSGYNGNNWISTYCGAKGSNYEIANNQISCIIEDKSGNMWLGISDVPTSLTNVPAIYKFNGVTWTPYTMDDNVAGNNILCTYVDSKGNLWAGAYGGVSKFNGTTWVSYTTSNGLKENHVTAITENPKGEMCFGTYSMGISVFDGSTWSFYNKTDGLPNDSIRSLVYDNKGNLWIGTKRGLCMFDGIIWNNFDPNPTEPKSKEINDLFVDSHGNLWVATNNGIYKLDDANGINYNINNSLVLQFNSNTNFLNIQSPTSSKNTIFNIYGQIMYKNNAAEGDLQINFNNLPNGIYIAVIETADLTKTLKFIKN